MANNVHYVCQHCGKESLKGINFLDAMDGISDFKNTIDQLQADKKELIEYAKAYKEILDSLGDAEELHGNHYIKLCQLIKRMEG